MATYFFRVAVLLALAQLCVAAAGIGRKLTFLVEEPPLVLTYHKGEVLRGNIPFNIVWYGQFKPAQKAIVIDFFNSLQTPNPNPKSQIPSVNKWWQLVETYISKTGMKPNTIKISIGKQVSDEKCSLGKKLSRAQIGTLAAKIGPMVNSITFVLTSKDVVVEGFCMSNCGFHASGTSKAAAGKFAYIWVGNSEMQCPGQCAWPFHQPIYGPQMPVLEAPNADVGLDGMIINIASLLAGASTNPYGNGFYQGPANAQQEAASACPGMYGKNSFPGYPGEVILDKKTGASYNAKGVNGREFMLPAVVDPRKSICATLI